ncbi:MAG: hypothetical protein KKA81_06835 [Bacteroidetes bacterium]|nr:hypothetical protein [Bacteroidota bacterium]
MNIKNLYLYILSGFLKMIKIPDFIKIPIGNFYLNKDISSLERKKKVINLDSAGSVGISYFLESDEDYLEIAEFVDFLHKKGIRVKAIGYVKDKFLTNRYLPKLTYDFVYEKDLNWYGKPGGMYVREFLKNNFDVFIDLSRGDLYPLKYIAANSRAGLKVGRNIPSNRAIFDLMISQEEPFLLKPFIKEVTHYLTIINKN